MDACRSTRTTSTQAMTRTRSLLTSPRRPRPRSCWPRSAPRTVAGRHPVNAWWGSFDLAVNLFSGRPAEPPSDDYLMRNAMDAEEVAVGWWPGDGALRQGGVLRLRASRAATDSPDAPCRPRAGMPRSASTSSIGTTSARAQIRMRVALDFAQSAFRHACAVCAMGRCAGRQRGGNTAAAGVALRIVEVSRHVRRRAGGEPSARTGAQPSPSPADARARRRSPASRRS